MKLQFLGTGAADWNIRARRDGEFFRRFSSALVNRDLLIDPGPHIYDFAEQNGTPGMFLGVTDIIVTHSHGDHYVPETVARLCREADHPIRLWGSAAIFRKLEGLAPEEMPLLCPLETLTAAQVGGYTVLPCRSNHGFLMEGEQTFNYIVSDGERSFFYGTDSGWIMYDTWLAIKKAKPNAVVFECTLGDVWGDDRVFGHTSIPMIEIMLRTMRDQHGTADDCKFYTTHMARTLHGSHEALRERLAPLGVTPAYDGFETEI